MSYVSWSRLRSWCLAGAGLSFLALLTGCATFDAPYQYMVDVPDGMSGRSARHVILPPGAAVSKEKVTFVIEHDDARASCLVLRPIEDNGLKITSVYWRGIGKRGTRVDWLREKSSCVDKGLRQCLRETGKRVNEAISARLDWKSCSETETSLQEALPYEVNESLQEGLGYTVITPAAASDGQSSVEPAQTSDAPTTPDKNKVKELGEVSSVSLRPGMKLCVQAEQSFTRNSTDRSRQGTAELCRQFVDAGDGLLAFPAFDRSTHTTYSPLLDADTTAAIHGVHEWSGIRSHAVEKLGNEFQLAVYFPEIQDVSQDWKPDRGVFLITNPEARNAGPLILLSQQKRALPPGRRLKMSELCGSNLNSCFMFMDRPSVRITHGIRMGSEVLEADLGTTLRDLTVLHSLPQVELLRPYRGKPVPVRRGDQIPLLPGDTLRSLQ